jgi:PEP-CTERM motif
MPCRNARFAAALLAACAFFVPLRTAEADPVGIDFALFPASGPSAISGSGTVIVDSSFLRPGTILFDLDDLIDFSLSLSIIPGEPSVTSFSKSDLSSWIFAVAGNPLDPTNFGFETLNFFMANRPANMDGYSIEGISEHVLAVCGGPSVQGSCGSSPSLGIAGIAVGPGNIHPVPEPGSMTLLGSGMAGLALCAKLRRRRNMPGLR